MDRWFDAYSKWPATSQVVFSLVALVLGLILSYMVGVWLLQSMHYIGVWARGWPPEEKSGEDFSKVNAVLKQIQNTTPPLAGIYDWKTEVKKIAEEEKYQRDLEKKLQAEMEQASEPSKRKPENAAQ